LEAGGARALPAFFCVAQRCVVLAVGAAKPAAAILRRIAGVLDVTLDDLVPSVDREVVDAT